MEMFLLHRDPLESARLHTDADVVDMVVRAAAYMSTAHVRWKEARFDALSESWLLNENDRAIYPPKPADCLWANWTAETPENYRWMRALLEGFLREYQRRYGDEKGKRHRTHDLHRLLWNPPRSMVETFDESPQPGLMTAWPDALACWESRLSLEQRVNVERFRDPVSRHRMAYRSIHRGDYRHDPLPSFMGYSVD